ncbi:MAG: hypothetical protein KIT62_07410 [Cyclobacteriaceae bacterium]|nr:hypothetical protein [Cyclobacteriaceae bacterium]
MKKRSLLFAALILLFCPAFAQDAVLHPEKLSFGETLYEYERVTGKGSEVFGTIHERIVLDQEAGTLIISFIQKLPNVTVTDTIIADKRTFVPIKYHSFVPGIQDILVTYRIPGETVINMNRKVPGYEADTLITEQTNEVLYDYHWPHLILYAIRSWEKKDAEINLPVFTYANKKANQSFYFDKEEILILHGREYKCAVWKITSTDPKIEKLYWIDTETNRLVQSKSSLADGGILWMKLKL